MSGISQKALAEALSLTTRQVRNLTDEGVFVRRHDGTALTYDLAACVAAYMQYKLERQKPVAEDATKELRQRKLIAEVRAAEIAVEEAEGRLIPLDVHEQRVGAICDRLRAVLMVVPSKYLGRIQMARTDVEAQAVGEQLRDELLRAMQATADDIEDELAPAEDETADAA